MKTEDVLEKFGEMIISRMEKMKKSNWKKGWFTTTYRGNPINLRGSQYSGTNAFFLFLNMMDNEKWKYPIFATFNQIKELGGCVLKGEKSSPVIFWDIQYKDKDGNRLNEDAYNAMAISAKTECKAQPILRSFNVFNIAQTDLEKVKPQKIQKLKDKFGIAEKEEMPTDTFGMYENAEIDEMLTYQKWLCPIHFDGYSNSAFYRKDKDEITIPQKSQFRKGETTQDVYEDGEEYYATLIHEMIHSTGHKDRLNRQSAGTHGDADYAKEELVAELGAALCGNILGFSSRVLDNNAAYLDAWIGRLKKQPRFIVSVLADASKASKIVLETIKVTTKSLVPSL